MSEVLTTWALVLGVLLPPVIAVVQRPSWSNRLRSVVTVLICTAVGGMTAWLSGDLSLPGHSVEEILGAIAVVIVAAQTAHRNFWKTTGISDVIEQATSPASAARYDE